MGLSAHKPNIIRHHNLILPQPKTTLSQAEAMELPAALPPSWRRLYPSPLLFPYHIIPENYVHWTETAESHIFSVDLPGVRKEEIKVEVEDTTYLIIRTEAIDESSEPAKSFMRKFRLPGMVDIGGISAGYENGVLTVTVPRSFRRREFVIDPADAPARVEIAARAA